MFVTFRQHEAIVWRLFHFFRDVRSRLIDFEVRWEVASSQVMRIAARSAFLEFVTDAAGATGAGEVVARSAARTPHPTRAGGQDDGSYTNSLKLSTVILYIYIYILV